MKKSVRIILIIILVIAGLSLMLYPTVSDYIQTLKHRRAIAEYAGAVQHIDMEAYDKLLSDAKEYNNWLIDSGSFLRLSKTELAEYENTFDVTGTGVMGYINIPSIDVLLPIYHGTDDMTLQVGVGHLEGSSLPVGGANTHTILSAHRGLPSAELFTNIDRLKMGDTFELIVLNEALTYEVDDIQTVLPSELKKLRIEDGEDLCTLVTCTPYGVNTHRLLVRGHRIATPESERIPLGMPDSNMHAMYVILAAAVLIVLIVVIIILYLKKRQKGGQNKGGLGV